MDRPNPPPPPPPHREKEPRRPAAPNGTNPILWVVLLAGLAAMLLLKDAMPAGSKIKLDYSDFARLIEDQPLKSAAAHPAAEEPKPATGADTPATPAVKSESRPAATQVTLKDGRVFDLRSPRKLLLGSYDVTGEVLAKQISDDPRHKEEVREFEANRSGYEDSIGTLKKDLQERGITFSYPEGPSAWRAWIFPLMTIALLALGFIYIMRRMGGTGSPMAFGRSRGKMYAQEDLEITFEDAAGIDEAVEELREVVEFLKTPEKYQTLGGRIPKGVLLVGPPGTGKTLLAKAIAGEAGVPFFSLSGSDFVEMFVGVGAARVRDMFRQAESKSPCIIFIDELDALGKTRGTSIVGGHDEREQTLNALLVEMDGFDSNSGVIVIAATNRPETLDPALLRPGRFDRHVLVDRPDVRGREAILKVHVGRVKLDPAIKLSEIARITSGFVGADLANLVNEACLLAARKGKSNVGMAEFNEGVERVTAGLEKKQRVMTEDEKKRVAYHEAGHALVGFCLPNTDPVYKVSIIPRGLAALGYTMYRPEDDRHLHAQSELESRIMTLLAGTLTEELVYEDVSTGAQNDLERASAIARAMVMDFGMSKLGRVNFRESTKSAFLAGSGNDFGYSRLHSEQTAREIDEEVKRIIDEAMEKVRDILRTRRAALEALTARLIEKEVVEADELREVIESNSTGPQIVPGTNTERKRTPVLPEAGEGPALGDVAEPR